MSISWAAVPEPGSSAAIDGLETRLQACLGGRVRDFQLGREEGGLVLRGRAQTYYARQLAAQVVQEITDLPIVANQIEVS